MREIRHRDKRLSLLADLYHSVSSFYADVEQRGNYMVLSSSSTGILLLARTIEKALLLPEVVKVHLRRVLFARSQYSYSERCNEVKKRTEKSKKRQ
jgi:hypothetical protein